MMELIAETAIDLLRVRQSAYEEALAKFQSLHRSARPIHTTDAPLPTIDDDYATWLDDQKAAVAREIKRIQRQTKREANEFRSKL